MINEAKAEVLDTLLLLGYFDLLIFVGCFLVFVLFYLLSSLLSRTRFFIPQFFKLCSYIVLLATPFLLYWMSQNVLCKHQVQYKMAKRLEYTPTFYVNATITNQGRLEIGRCYLIVDVLREGNHWRAKILNSIIPLKKYKFKVAEKIPVGKSQDFEKTINHFPYERYKTSLECYGR